MEADVRRATCPKVVSGRRTPGGERYSYDAYGYPVITSVNRHDVNYDGVWNSSDSSLIASHNGQSPCVAGPIYDINGNGTITFQDTILRWPPPPALVTLSESGLGNPYLFTGRRLDVIDDGNLLLYYNRRRPYSPEHGRWLTRDPAEYADGMNLYEYVKSRPTVLVDPDGRKACTKKVFTGVVFRRLKSSIGHAWLDILGEQRGFYPEGDKSIPLIVPGEWTDEKDKKIKIESPPGSGTYIYVVRTNYFVENGWYDQWQVKTKCSGELKYGGNKGTACKCATDGQILNCLRIRTRPGRKGTYCLIGGNCVDQATTALTDCCLRKDKKTFTGTKAPGGGSSGS